MTPRGRGPAAALGDGRAAPVQDWGWRLEAPDPATSTLSEVANRSATALMDARAPEP